MRVRLITTAALLSFAAAAAGGTAAYALVDTVNQVRSVYRTVLTAEYFGPSNVFCSRLTAASVKSFTAGGAGTCTHAFDLQQHVLKHKTKGVDDSGFTPAQWRQVVTTVMAHLKVRVHGSRASAIGGESGIPGQTTLVNVNGKWLFNSYPPSIEP